MPADDRRWVLVFPACEIGSLVFHVLSEDPNIDNQEAMVLAVEWFKEHAKAHGVDDRERIEVHPLKLTAEQRTQAV